jgi:hypothetical protein
MNLIVTSLIVKQNAAPTAHETPKTMLFDELLWVTKRKP